MLPSTYKTKVRFNQAIHGRLPGSEENVKTSPDGTLLDRQIRRRIKDNDGSVEVIGKDSKKVKITGTNISKEKPKSTETKGVGSGKKEKTDVNDK